MSSIKAASVFHTDSPAERDRLFDELVNLVHKLSHHFDVYIGRTYLRKGREHRGPQARWGDHRRTRFMTWGRVICRIRRQRIKRDEAFSIALVKLWGRLTKLCCNNDVMLSSGRVTQDPWQLVYICLREKGGL